MSLEISCFISPHGFGHATREIAVLEALSSLHPNLVVNLITTVPETLFQSSKLNYRYHQFSTDIGVKQKDSFSMDLEATSKALQEFVLFATDTDRLETICAKSRIILTDISILGIVIGKQCGIPSVLIENFTWDWIYSHCNEEDTFTSIIPAFKALYADVDVHIQTEPVCSPTAGNHQCRPIARPLSSEPQLFRKILGLDNKKIVLITTGGIRTELPFIDHLNRFEDYNFIITGQNHAARQNANVYTLSATTELHHPDLIAGADLVVCKTGYSTIAECCQSYAAVACVSRPMFAESRVLERFVTDKLQGTIINEAAFLSGEWLERLSELSRPRDFLYGADGAQEAARIISALIY